MNNTKIQLSSKQKEIASHTTGALLVLASAGSGKTRVLTERIKNLVQITKRKILAITFTNMASEEIKERLQDEVDISETLFVGTFHSFCISVLENHGSVIGYQEVPQIFSNTEDRLKIIEATILNTPSLRFEYENYDSKEKSNFRYRALEAIAQIKRDVILDEDLDGNNFNESTVLLYRGYKELMSSLNAIDFDDLLLITYELFINNPQIVSLYRRNYEYICIDEAQDMNKAQYMVLRALTGDEHKNVMLVGDPKQAIYGFNGSSSDYMTTSFRKHFSPIEISLTENYRSSKKVLELANKITPDPSSLDNIVIEGVCEIVEFENVEEEARWVVSKIQTLLNNKYLNDIEGEITFDNIAILARNKYVLSAVESKLTESKISYYYKSSSSEVVFDSEGMKFLNLALQVKINPMDRLHLAQLQRIIGLKGLKNLNDIKQNINQAIYKDIIDIVLNINDDGSNMKQKITLFLNKVKSEDNYSGINENERVYVYNDCIEFLKHWQRYQSSTNNPSVSSFRNAMALGQTFKNTENHGITLSTVHTMKGQENDIVFIIGMDNETFPDYRALAKGGIEMEQEKNNLYVAITRAKRYLYVTYPKSRIMPWGGVRGRVKSILLKGVEATIIHENSELL